MTGKFVHHTTTQPSSSCSKSISIASSSSMVACAICLDTVKQGMGNAIFTAECSHSFHFQCIASNVKHGNKICPICRAKWKQVPLQSPITNVSLSHHHRPQPQPQQVRTPRANSPLHPQPQQVGTSRANSPHHRHAIIEPAIFNDDEEVEHRQAPIITHNIAHDMKKIEMKTYPEVGAVSKSESRSSFSVLINLKAPPAHSGNQRSLVNNSCAPIDLVTVLDTSGSMGGSKIALLKQAMSFVIQNLTQSDRLSVIVFSNSAHRIFPLRRMTDSGKAQALRDVNSLVAEGNTNIAEGLKKGVKVFVDRRWKNPVSSIILLSDGQDNYYHHHENKTSFFCWLKHDKKANYRSILPKLIQRNNLVDGLHLHIPVHAFGFGADHDATLMHSIAEMSGGTFSFIEAQNVIQDAFAQCIGGLLSVVVQELKVQVECANSHIHLSSVKAGSYQTSLTNHRRVASIKVGDMYAEEEKDFLVTLNIPVVDKTSHQMLLLNVKGSYNDPITKTVGLNVTSEVKIQRPDVARDVVVSIEVDRQRNRFAAAEAMNEARVKAEHGEFTAAIAVLDKCRNEISQTVSASDPLCVALCAELKEMQQRMANRRVYEESGRAYVLSGLSSHSGQRATARGDSTETTTFIHGYTTTSMVDMVSLSQTQIFGKQALPSETTQRKKK